MQNFTIPFLTFNILILIRMNFLEREGKRLYLYTCYKSMSIFLFFNLSMLYYPSLTFFLNIEFSYNIEFLIVSNIFYARYIFSFRFLCKSKLLNSRRKIVVDPSLWRIVGGKMIIEFIAALAARCNVERTRAGNDPAVLHHRERVHACAWVHSTGMVARVWRRVCVTPPL